MNDPHLLFFPFSNFLFPEKSKPVICAKSAYYTNECTWVRTNLYKYIFIMRACHAHDDLIWPWFAKFPTLGIHPQQFTLTKINSKSIISKQSAIIIAPLVPLIPTLIPHAMSWTLDSYHSITLSDRRVFLVLSTIQRFQTSNQAPRVQGRLVSIVSNTPVPPRLVLPKLPSELPTMQIAEKSARRTYTPHQSSIHCFRGC